MHYYHFRIYLAYPTLNLPRKYDFLIVPLFWMAGYRGAQLQALNRCRLALKLFFSQTLLLHAASSWTNV
jgi:hypothetical protein